MLEVGRALIIIAFVIRQLHGAGFAGYGAAQGHFIKDTLLQACATASFSALCLFYVMKSR